MIYVTSTWFRNLSAMGNNLTVVDGFLLQIKKVDNAFTKKLNRLEQKSQPCVNKYFGESVTGNVKTGICSDKIWLRVRLRVRLVCGYIVCENWEHRSSLTSKSSTSLCKEKASNKITLKSCSQFEQADGETDQHNFW